jgi:hypothetical protein
MWIVIAAVPVIASAVVALGACMLASRCSRALESQELRTADHGELDRQQEMLETSEAVAHPVA